jgi:hypothetical protein
VIHIEVLFSLIGAIRERNAMNHAIVVKQVNKQQKKGLPEPINTLILAFKI